MPLTLFAILLLAVLGWLWLRNQPPARRKPALVKLVLLVLAAGLAALALTGRLYLVIGALAALYPWLRRLLPGLLRGAMGGGLGGAGATSGNQSHVATEILDMTLDHDSGTMTGEVVSGPLAGRALEDLGEAEFLDLLRYCRQQDADSARLLETYLDRRFGDSWRDDDPQSSDDTEAPQPGSGPLTEREALDILGLEPGASREDIIQAHRRMMQKVHPDHGGSNYLAARINEAKECLLN